MPVLTVHHVCIWVLLCSWCSLSCQVPQCKGGASHLNVFCEACCVILVFFLRWLAWEYSLSTYCYCSNRLFQAAKPTCPRHVPQSGPYCVICKPNQFPLGMGMLHWCSPRPTQVPLCGRKAHLCSHQPAKVLSVGRGFSHALVWPLKSSKWGRASLRLLPTHWGPVGLRGTHCSDLFVCCILLNTNHKF